MGAWTFLFGYQEDSSEMKCPNTVATQVQSQVVPIPAVTVRWRSHRGGEDSTREKALLGVDDKLQHRNCLTRKTQSTAPTWIRQVRAGTPNIPCRQKPTAKHIAFSLCPSGWPKKREDLHSCSQNVTLSIRAST